MAVSRRVLEVGLSTRCDGAVVVACIDPAEFSRRGIRSSYADLGNKKGKMGKKWGKRRRIGNGQSNRREKWKIKGRARRGRWRSWGNPERVSSIRERMGLAAKEEEEGREMKIPGWNEAPFLRRRRRRRGWKGTVGVTRRGRAPGAYEEWWRTTVKFIQRFLELCARAAVFRIAPSQGFNSRSLLRHNGHRRVTLI